MLLLGIDLGTSSIKVSVVDAATQNCLASAFYPETEAEITSRQTGWAEQSPETWWEHTKKALAKLHASKKYDPSAIAAIGIAYQMHGLVLVDKDQKVLRDSIIWCDSRAVEIGNAAFEKIGAATCMSCLLNSPGNFTASKLAWVKQNEPELYAKADRMLLPGDFLAMKLTGKSTTTSSALSEGILWDFKSDVPSNDVMEHYGFRPGLIPSIQPLFSVHGTVSEQVAKTLSIPVGIPVSYKAGDQLNNALSLNVLRPGEVAATAGTSGVIYAVTDTLLHDQHSRVNAFAHVNHAPDQKRLGVLLCINGTGIMNRWIRQVCGEDLDYAKMNSLASTVPPGSEGVKVLPFGNGAERMLQNRIVDAHVYDIDLNKHGRAHLLRAVQEGIAFAFRYGLDIMRENGIRPKVIRAGKANMFLSEVFTQAFVDATGVPVELYNNDGSVGAALGAGIGAGIFKDYESAFSGLKPLQRIEPRAAALYDGLFVEWKKALDQKMKERNAS
jgi:xylulokinase